MTSKEVMRYYKDIGMDKLYKKCEKYFNLIDNWADEMIEGDLLSEQELHKVMEQVNGCQTKLNSIAGALEAMCVEYENKYQIQEESKYEKLRVQDQNSAKAKARENVSDLRMFASDFTRYVQSAQAMVVTAQSRIKRLSIEKGNKGIAFSGDTSNV